MNPKTNIAFLDYLNQWYLQLPAISLPGLLKDRPADATAVVSVDVVNGFAKEGNLSSSRIAAIVQPIVNLFRAAQQNGIREFLLLQDTHPANSKEFLIYRPHCIEGTHESNTVEELRAIPGFDHFQVMPKKTINPGIEDGLRNWMKDHSGLQQILLVGDCTDICVYLLAIFFKSWQVLQGKDLRVVVPADCVDTYDVPLQPDQKNATPPHPGEFLHILFLYHMQLNGAQIVRSITRS